MLTDIHTHPMACARYVHTHAINNFLKIVNEEIDRTKTRGKASKKWGNEMRDGKKNRSRKGKRMEV